VNLVKGEALVGHGAPFVMANPSREAAPPPVDLAARQV
jgi:hypothetical protein